MSFARVRCPQRYLLHLTYPLIPKTTVISLLDIFPHSSMGLIFLALFLYNCTLAPLAFVLSTFLQNERVAALVAGVGSIAFGAPTFALARVDAPALKLALSLFSPLALSGALSTALVLETENAGVQLANVGERRSGYSFLLGLALLLGDLALYLALAWYLFQVVPGNSGITRHPFFCLLPANRQRGLGASSPSWSPLSSSPSPSPSTSPARALLADAEDQGHGGDGDNGGDGGGGGEGDEEGDWEGEDAALVEPVAAELKAFPRERTVRLDRLSKAHTAESGAQVQALTGISLTMYQGQIFCLLGHNGAGKVIGGGGGGRGAYSNNTLTLRGTDLMSSRPQRRRQGYRGGFLFP